MSHEDLQEKQDDYIESNIDATNIDDPSDMFSHEHYVLVPKIPEGSRGSDVIGIRTKPGSGTTAVKIGPIQPKNKLKRIWADLTDVKKYIMMLISEHRHMTVAQLSVLINAPSNNSKTSGRIDVCRTYWRWVSDVKYRFSLDYKKTFQSRTQSGLSKMLKELCRDGLLEEITPSYAVAEKHATKKYKDSPALFTRHYYLTELGAKVLICNTDANRPGSTVKPVGFVPTYKNAAFQSILHEAESTEILCSMISCANYITNIDSGRKYGLIDLCRFYHEKDTVEKDVEFKEKKDKVFKPDGKITFYIERLGDFIDWYIEYDSGSSTKSKIEHKIKVFVKYIFWKRQQDPSFRKPVLLMITQKPSDFFPQLTGRKSTPYTTAIKNLTRGFFEEYLDDINDIATVLIADCGAIREKGAMGACWHRLDLASGIAETDAYDLLEASKNVCS